MFLNIQLPWLSEKDSAELILVNEPLTDFPITSVFCFIHLNNKILLVKSKKENRNWEICGGHLEKDETPVQAIKRESLEEGFVKITTPILLGYYKIQNNSTLQYPSTSYQAFYMATVDTINPFLPNQEVEERHFFTKEEFLEKQWVRENIHLSKAFFKHFST